MKQKVYLIGVGMGTPATLTQAGRDAIEACALLIGAPRLLEPYGHKACCALISAAEIAARIAQVPAGPVGVLLSGDIGFYSGAAGLRAYLSAYEVVAIPGVSSLPYFCAKLGVSWQDVHLVSAHGRTHNAVGEIQSHRRTFLLTGGETRVEDICRALTRCGMGALSVSVGQQLGYDDEAITVATAEELAQQTFPNLCVMLVDNPFPVVRRYSAPGMPDDAFRRGKAPMTKREIRVLALSQLRLEPHHILWDVGAGTGSVSIEGALCVPQGRVFAVEKNPEALALLEENRAAFSAWNIEITPGEAPQALAALPAPDRVFLGGSTGQMREILTHALKQNHAVRVVVTAVTLETLHEACECAQALGLADVEIEQVAVTKTRVVGRYHMMDAANPVWIISGEGCP